MSIDLDATAYALDALTIDLCLSMFPWARFRQTKGAVKLHTLLNLQGNIPEFILISAGKLHYVNVLDHLILSPGAYYVMDRGYLDFTRLYQLHQASDEPEMLMPFGYGPDHFSQEALRSKCESVYHARE